MDVFGDAAQNAAQQAVLLGAGVALVIWSASVVWLLIRHFSGHDEKEASDYQSWQEDKNRRRFR